MKNQSHWRMINFKNNYEQTLLYSKLEIQEEAIQTVNQEIHDNIGQVLSLAKIQLNTMPGDLMNETAAETIAHTKNLLGQAIIDLRKLSKRLQPDNENEFNLEKNIRQKLDDLKKTTDCHTKLNIAHIPYKIPVQIQIILFRIVQEVISNVMRHASASSVTVTMNYHPLCFSLLVEDNGVGPMLVFDNSIVNQEVRLKIMSSRLEAIGAKLSLEEIAGVGTTVTIALPIMEC